MNKKLLRVIPLLILAVMIATVVLACSPKEKSGLTISLSAKSLEMDALEQAQLVATVTESGKEVEKNITWKSDNEAVAKVEGGKVTALTAGTATVTAEVGGKKAQCQVTVSAVVRPMMMFAKAEYEVGKGTTNQILPMMRVKSQNLDAKEYGITYSFTSSDTEIATVNAKGVITGVKVGKTEITVTASFPMAAAAGLDGELTAQVPVSVVPDYTLSIELGEGEVSDIYLQEAVIEEVTHKDKLSLVVLEALYEDQDITEFVTFCSSDDTIAVVSDDGIVTLGADAREGDEVDVWARYVTPEEGEVNSNRITLTVRKAVVTKEIKGDLIIDLGAGGKINSRTVFGSNMKIVDVYDSEDAYKISLWNAEKNCLDKAFVQTLGERSLVIVGEKISYQVNALVVTKTIRTGQEFANIFWRSNQIPKIKADGYYILGNNIDMSEVEYKGRGWNATDGYGLVGTFDGRGYTMNGLNMPQGGGIFGVISSKATLKNVAFTNVKMVSNGHAVILGYGVYGTVENVFVGITELGSTLDSANTTVGLCAQTNTANTLNNIVVMCSARIEHPAKTVKYGILEGGTNKGGWDNTFVIAADQLFGGEGTAGTTGTSSAKHVQRFSSLSGILGSKAYASRKKNFSTDIWDLSTMTFKSSRQYFRDEINELPDSLEISVKKEMPLFTNYRAFNISANNSSLKIKEGAVTATGAIAGKDKATITVSWGGVKKVIAIKTRQEKTVDVSFNMNLAGQKDLTVSGLPVKYDTVTVYFPGLDGNEIAIPGTCVNGKLVVKTADIQAVEKTIASGEQSLRIDYGGEDSYYVNGVKLAWVISTADEFMHMREHMVLTEDTYYGMIALNADLDFANVKIANAGMSGKYFSGIFDGRNHKISNLNATSPNVGLLGNVSGVVKNLRLENATVSTNTAAVIGGELSGTAENIYVQGSITADGMSANSNLSNFGCGLLAGRIVDTAVINNVIVEVQSIASGLRLGTAFGKLHSGAPETVFTNCYAVNASGKTYMYGNAGNFTKKNFSAASTNANFADMAALWDNGKAALLAQSLGLVEPLKGVYTDLVYYMNDGVTEDLIVSGLELDLPTVKVYLVALDGSEIEMNASCTAGTLVIDSASMEAAYSQIATGQQPIRLDVAGESQYVLGAQFVWVINNADEFLKMRDHLTADGNNYYGMLALGADIDLAKVRINNTGMAGKTFTGIFDGRFHTLYNVNAANPNVGVLGNVSGTVMNLRVENAIISTNTAAVIGGSLTGTACNIYVSGSITADGMNASSNLSNFGAGLLAGRIEKSASVDSVIVEVHSIGQDLVLASAFGKLHGGALETVFTNSYVINAENRAFMENVDSVWTFKAFDETNGKGNKNFATMQALGESNDSAVLNVIETLGLNCTELGHLRDLAIWDWNEDYSVAQMEATCGRCGDVAIYAADVTLGEGSVSASCTAPGLAVYVATVEVNGVLYTDSRTVTIPQMTHTVTHAPAQEATCLDAGNVEYWYCPGCLKYYTDAEGTKETTLEAVTLPTTGHNFDQLVATAAFKKSAGTETQRSVYYKSCICGTAGTDVFYGNYAKAMDVNNGQNLIIEHDVFTGSGSATVKVGNVTLSAMYSNGKLVITDGTLKAASKLPSGDVDLVVTYGAKTVTIDDIQLVWVINNWDEMAVMENHMVVSGDKYTGYLALGADFSMNGKVINNWLWRDATVYTFDGIFDGRNYTISDVAIASPLKGLFKSVGPNGVIKNLKVTQATVSTYAAVLVGYQLYGTVENVYVQGAITADGMSQTSNLSNFGSGLLASQIFPGAKIQNAVVEVTEMAQNLRLATAFGKIHQVGATEETVFTNCYAVNANGYTFMPFSETKEWTKSSFAAEGENLNFATMDELWSNAKAKELALSLGMEAPIEGALKITLNSAYEMNAQNGGNLVVQHAGLTGTHSGTVTITGSNLTLSGATISGGKLTIPASAFQQDTMPSGVMTLVAQFGDRPVEITGEFIWVINDWPGLAYMEKHMVAAGANYTGSLALGADIDASGKTISNFLWKDSALYTFNGTFDGRNHTISNLTASTALKGLFKSVGKDGVIKNLKMTNATVSTYTAALVGFQLYGTVENVYVQGSITGDGMGVSSNLANFGSGLLTGQIMGGAKITNCIVELTDIKDGLRLATAFGKLHQAAATEANVFTNCYAVGAEGCTFMQYSTWTKVSFTAGSGNKNFTTMAQLWADSVAAALAEALGLKK